ncbi:MAG: arginase family protein [Bacteriovoracaceae bacterium]|nr:arginase family protein [Bacteriovoracaceae bacterium]
MKFIDVAGSWLCPPGEGVFTVSTAKEKREHLQKKYYPNGVVREEWLKNLKNLQTEKFAILGVPSDCGGGILRGANWGPLFIREELLKDGMLPCTDLGDVRVVPHLLHDKYLNEKTLSSVRKALFDTDKNSWPVSPLSLCEESLRLLYQDYPQLKVLALGGDHSVSYPLVKAWAESRKKKKIGLLHFDAHTDLLEQRLGIDLNFGSWTYHVREFFPHPDQLIQVGIRSTGKERSHWEKNLNVTQHWASEIHKKGMPFYITEVLSAFKRKNIEEVYISFDIDALDSSFASATGTPENKGLDPVACVEMIRQVSKEFNVTGCDLVEVAPFINHNFAPNMGQETTMMTAASIARALARALGVHA